MQTDNQSQQQPLREFTHVTNLPTLPFPSHGLQLLFGFINSPSHRVQDKVSNDRFGDSVSGIIL